MSAGACETEQINIRKYSDAALKMYYFEGVEKCIKSRGVLSIFSHIIVYEIYGSLILRQAGGDCYDLWVL